MHLISNTSQHYYLEKKSFLSQINIMKNQAAGGGYKNESFFNNFFQCGRFHMSRHILLLNPTLIFKRLFFSFAYKITLIRAKRFAHMLSLPGKERSPCVSLSVAPAGAPSTPPQSSGTS